MAHQPHVASVASFLREAERARLFTILHRFQLGTLVTRGDGFVHTQPLAVAAIDEGEEEIVFVTIGDSDAARDVRLDPRATVVFQDARHCASWMGHADLSHDTWRIARLWREDMRIWFPVGPSDPRLVLLSVHGEVGEYWDVSRTRRTLTTIRRIGHGGTLAEEPAAWDAHAWVRIREDEETSSDVPLDELVDR